MHTGLDVVADLDGARRWLKVAADGGDQEALTQLAALSGDAPGGSAADRALADARKLEADGRHGDAVSQYRTLADAGDPRGVTGVQAGSTKSFDEVRDQIRAELDAEREAIAATARLAEAQASVQVDHRLFFAVMGLVLAARMLFLPFLLHLTEVQASCLYRTHTSP